MNEKREVHPYDQIRLTRQEDGSWTIILVVSLGIVAGGCTTASVTATAEPPVMAIPAVLSEEVADVELVRSPPAGAYTKEIAVTACQRLVSDPRPTDEYALALLKQEAKRHGSSAVASVRYQHGTGHLAANCWHYITASGVSVDLR